MHDIDLLERHLHGPGPCISTGTNTDQNCAPTWPARRRGKSVIIAAWSGGGLIREVSLARSIAASRAVEARADHPRQVIVAIDQRGVGEHARDPRVVVAAIGRGGGAHE